jgi:hypothetical protein
VAESKDISNSTAERLAALSETYRDAKETFERHRDRWHEAITEAVDAGMKPADVAGIVKVSPQRVQAILARVYARDDS